MKTIRMKSMILCLLFSASFSMAQTFTNYSTADGLPDNNVMAVAIDGHHWKWLGTQNGLAKFNDTSWTVYTTSNGLIDNYINCVASDQNNNIWIGTDFGVSKFDGINWTSYTTADGLISNTIADIAIDIDGSIWIGTNSGLSHLSGSTWTSFTTANGLANNMISTIAIDDAGNKWIGTWIGGLSKYNGSTFTTFTTAQGLVDNNITAVAIDALGNKWIGTYYGLTVLNNSDAWTANYIKANGLYNNYIQDIVFDTNNVKWFGIFADYILDGAITRFTGTTWASYSTPEGLVDKMVNQLAIDRGTIIWVATGNGVSKMDIVTGITDHRQPTEFSVFPNPAKGVTRIPAHDKAVRLEIIDITGQLKVKTTLEAGNDNIDISNLKPGIYHLQLNDNDKFYSSKLIIL